MISLAGLGLVVALAIALPVWGLGLMPLAADGAANAWSLVSPVMMTFLLLKVSGAVLLEQDIAQRRPACKNYIARTSTFNPWPPRRGAGT